jgi:hypothetical protein
MDKKWLLCGLFILIGCFDEVLVDKTVKWDVYQNGIKIDSVETKTRVRKNIKEPCIKDVELSRAYEGSYYKLIFCEDKEVMK